MALPTNNLTVYGDSTPSFVVKVFAGTDERNLVADDLRDYEIRADIDDPDGTRIAGWTITYGDQDDPEYKGIAVVDLLPADVDLLRAADGRTFVYDVRFERTADGSVFFCPVSSNLVLSESVTEDA